MDRFVRRVEPDEAFHQAPGLPPEAAPKPKAKGKPKAAPRPQVQRVSDDGEVIPELVQTKKRRKTEEIDQEKVQAMVLEKVQAATGPIASVVQVLAGVMQRVGAQHDFSGDGCLSEAFSGLQAVLNQVGGQPVPAQKGAASNSSALVLASQAKAQEQVALASPAQAEMEIVSMTKDLQAVEDKCRSAGAKGAQYGKLGG